MSQQLDPYQMIRRVMFSIVMVAMVGLTLTSAVVVAQVADGGNATPVRVDQGGSGDSGSSAGATSSGGAAGTSQGATTTRPRETTTTVARSSSTSTTRPPRTTPTSTTVPGDLALSEPMSRPQCDGSYITLVGAAIDPSLYRAAISDILRNYPGSDYLRTDVTCPSLRAAMPNGDAIYAAYLGPFSSFEEACRARSRGPADAYVKRLDTTTDPNFLPQCP